MRTNVATTSIGAYHDHVQTFEEAQELRILDFIKAKGPATIGEIAKALLMEKSSVSARQNKLRNKDFALVWAEERRKCNVSGVLCHVLQLPKGQAELFS